MKKKISMKKIKKVSIKRKKYSRKKNSRKKNKVKNRVTKQVGGLAKYPNCILIEDTGTILCKDEYGVYKNTENGCHERTICPTYLLYLQKYYLPLYKEIIKINPAVIAAEASASSGAEALDAAADILKEKEPEIDEAAKKISTVLGKGIGIITGSTEQAYNNGFNEGSRNKH